MPVPPIVVIELQDVSVRCGGVLALERVSVTVDRGAVVAVIGPNGAGKSTLLGAIGGRVRPTAGSVLVRGSVSDVPQSTAVDREVRLPVLDVVRMGRFPARGLLRRFRAADHAAVHAALEAMDLLGLERRTIDSLSGGQRQRVLVAQGLAQEADVVLLDEPTAALDAPSQRRLIDAVRTEASRGRTVVFATHAMDEACRADVVLVLAGRVVRCGSPAVVFDDPDVERLFAHRPLRAAAASPTTAG